MENPGVGARNHIAQDTEIFFPEWGVPGSWQLLKSVWLHEPHFLIEKIPQLLKSAKPGERNKKGGFVSGFALGWYSTFFCWFYDRDLLVIVMS